MSKQILTLENVSSLGTQDGNEETTVGTFKQDSSIELEVKDIDNTPFKSVKTPDGYMLTFGKWAISSKKFKSHKEAARYVNQTDWQMILNVIGIMTDYQIEIKGGK